MAVSEKESRTKQWTCSRCAVTVSWMAGAERASLPAQWARHNGHLYCLACRRSRAAEEAIGQAGPGASREDIAQLRAAALIEFEIRRDPDRGTGDIARVCRSSVAAVAKARKRLGIPEASAARAR